MINTPLIPVPLVVEVVKEIKPESILDIGCGFGRYGFLFREALDVSFQNSHSFARADWERKIDAVEVCADYITELQKYIYNRIFIGDIIKIIDEDILGNYDIIFMGDVIEHLNRASGWRLLDWAYANANKMVVIATPSFFMSGLENDEYAIHRSLWRPADFGKFPNKKMVILENRVLCVFLAKQNVNFYLPIFRRNPVLNSAGKYIYKIMNKNPVGIKILSLIRNVKERRYYKKF